MGLRKDEARHRQGLDGSAARAVEDDPALRLTGLLGLGFVDLAVTGARIVGQGSDASCDIFLSNETAITFERMRDLAQVSRLAVEVALATGATPKLKGPAAIEAIALIRQLADYRAQNSIDALSCDWGLEFLQSARPLEFDFDDQADRWRAFKELERYNPWSLTLGNDDSFARRCLVLIHKDGTRFVRTGWFRHYVKRDDALLTYQQILVRMERVGWKRRNKEGRIKATRPHGLNTNKEDGPPKLAWRFYIVEPGWEAEVLESGGSRR